MQLQGNAWVRPTLRHCLTLFVKCLEDDSCDDDGDDVAENADDNDDDDNNKTMTLMRTFITIITTVVRLDLSCQWNTQQFLC